MKNYQTSNLIFKTTPINSKNIYIHNVTHDFFFSQTLCKYYIKEEKKIFFKGDPLTL